MNLADISTDQMQAVSHRRYPWKSPLEERIHAELPAKKEEGLIKTQKELVEKEIAQEERQSLAELAASEEQARKSEGISAIGMGLSAGKMLKDWGGSVSKLAPVGLGLGIGYGVAKYTDKPALGVAAGAAATLATSTNVVGGVIGKIADFVTKLF